VIKSYKTDTPEWRKTNARIKELEATIAKLKGNVKPVENKEGLVAPEEFKAFKDIKIAT